MDHLDPPSPALTSDEARLKQAILDSAHDDTPPAGGRAQVLAKLKLTPEIGSGAASSAWRFTFGRSASLVGLVVAASAASIGAGFTMFAAKPTAPSSAQEQAPAPMAAPIATPTSDPETTVDVSALPSSGGDIRQAPTTTNVPAARPASKPAAARSAESDDSSLARELARVTAARNALTGGDAPSALRWLDAYDAEFPRGTFSVEVSVLRIEALARAGRIDEAKELGNRFLARYPQGVLARRVATTLRAVGPQEPTTSPTDR